VRLLLELQARRLIRQQPPAQALFLQCVQDACLA
jgi:hypothetical protein